jgi:DNA-binding transcriptional LysR family regulator
MLRKIDWESQIGRRLKLRDLHVFCTAVRCGSMAKAAQQLGVSQPAVSEVVADLEHALGVRLLDRNRKGVEPTIYGQALLKRGLVAFDELRQSIRDIESLADPATGQLTVGCADSIAATLLPPILDLFFAKYPRVAVRVDTASSPMFDDPGLRNRKYDLVLARVLIPLADLADDLSADFLFDDRLVLAAGMHTRWARRRKIELAELVEEPWMLAPTDSWSYARLAEVFRAQALTMPKVSLMTYSLPLIIHFLANGPTISVFPYSVMRSYAARGALKILPIDLPIRPWPVAILTLKGRTLSPVAERFAECARDAVKSLLGGSPSRAPKPG